MSVPYGSGLALKMRALLRSMEKNTESRLLSTAASGRNENPFTAMPLRFCWSASNDNSSSVELHAEIINAPTSANTENILFFLFIEAFNALIVIINN